MCEREKRVHWNKTNPFHATAFSFTKSLIKRKRRGEKRGREVA